MSTDTIPAPPFPLTPSDGRLIDGGPVLAALRAIRRGTFTVRLPMDQTGMTGEVYEAFNDVAELLEESTNAIERVSHAVGREGQITQRASLPGATGGWATRIEAINHLIGDIVGPTTEVSRVIGAVARGDLSQHMAIEFDGRRLEGEFLKLGNTVNTMVEQLGSFASEVTRVAREVGTDGKLGGQAVVKGVAGTWKDLTDNVNQMAGNLTSQVRNIAEVTTAVANGDLSKKITVDVRGEILDLKDTINTMVDQLSSFASEVTRVAREVGTDGKLGGQAVVKGVGGTWKDLTDNVNLMGGNLTSQVRNIAEVTTAVARGDLSKKITVDVKGEVLELKNTINTMVDQLSSFAAEVTRVAREVGTDGKLGGQAVVKGVAGTWKDLTDNVNLMGGNLTSQVRNIAEVTTAVANGDLSKKITVDVKGEVLELKNTINTMVDQLSSFAAEVTRVAREVGTDGKLGGQAVVKGVAGTWKDLTDNVNLMGGNLTSQVRNIAEVTTAVARGDLSKKITVDVKGEVLELKNTINTMVDQLQSFASEVTRVAREVGTDGKLGGQAVVKGVAGTWKDLTDNVNLMGGNLTSQVRNIAEVTTAVARGDLSKKITVDVKGEVLELKNTINTMVDQLSSFAAEVTRVAREVGTDGKLGGQAEVTGVAGTWKDLTDNVNVLAGNLTSQVRNIAEVTTAVARGDLSKKITVDVKGEILELKDTINTMVDQLSSFAAEVTRVAREVGTDGKLGGQAEVKGVAGTWKDLTDNVNAMAGNLTVQLRDVSKVATAIAKGDLSQKITVEVKGEILQIKDTINVMVDQLSSFAAEVTRVAREVGTDGKLGGQAEVKGVAGTWKDLTDNVNLMGGNLTSQVRNIAEVTTAVARGDLSKKITVDVKGEVLELKNTINTMVDQLSSFAAEVTRVAREVGTDGKLGGQAVVKGVAGTWKDLTDNVNQMAGNLTSQVRNIAEVTTAVANGDLSKKITVDVKGEVLELKDTINTMVDQLSSFAAEVTRVAREVGTDGKLGGQAVVKGVAGTWKDLTDNVNQMGGNLTSQVRNIAEVTTAVARGDLSKKITVDVKGEVLELKNTINTMVDQLQSFASEVTRVAREVGTDGKLGGQAEVKGVAGTWKDLTDNVNVLAGNLTSQVRNIAEVTTAVARGDLSKKITVDVKGEILELKNTINTMVDQLQSFASEVTRVAREVGTDGKLGGQAVVPGVAGTWKDLTDNVNAMGGNLTVQLRDVSKVATAIAKGDLSQKITVEVKGEILQIKETINTMVDQLNSFASEVTRVAREVGTDGKLGGQASVAGVAGTWKDLTDNVNAMAGNLTVQLRDVSKVATAIAKGDLGQKITVEVKGEILQIKDTINTMVDQLNSFASEVTRVAREVGTDGKLGGQAEVKGVAGTWKDLTDNVNMMAANLTSQVRNIAEVTIGVASGNLSKKITVDVRGEILQLKEALNTMVDQLRAFASEVSRVAREVGTDGKLGGQAVVPGVAGTWKDLTDNVNGMAANLTAQVRNIAQVTTAVAKGDLTQKITVDVKGEILELKSTINTMVDQLNGFAAEVTRVAREVGTDGKLGGQAVVKGVAGTWKDLTDNVNVMAANLTDQVRGIAKVVTATAKGNLKEKLTLPAKGEIAALADTINAMNDTLATLADQVTTVAREVGVEGKLGGQANVPGAAGTWKDLTDNVNELAANLTNQVRAIAEVATSVTKGDMSRTIKVEARGEVDELKNNINQMIGNLRDTTKRNTEQDWLKSNLAEFTRTLQGQRDLMAVAKLILSKLAPLVNAQHGVFYMADSEGKTPVMKLFSAYAYKERKGLANRFQLGEGLVGQCALEKERILMTDVPSEYVHINSGLGDATPFNIVVLPVVFEGQVRAVIELASFIRLTDIHLSFLDQLSESIGVVLNSIQAAMRTEDLLKQSQSQAEELQTQQEELAETNKRLEQQAATLRQSEELLKRQQEQLQQTNEELEEKAQALTTQKSEVEAKNQQIELARMAVQQKAEQLAMTSKYKSEFLANMSHELRTPLNSLLILSKILSDNAEGNLTPKQQEYCQTIHGSGSDLLSLINDVLDMAKVESGTVSTELGELRFAGLQDYVERTFRQVALSKGLEFSIDLDPHLPASMYTDGKRLQQVLKNLLSNALKFTEKGRVDVWIGPVTRGWSADQETLNRADRVIAFAVSDTGIGIPADKLRIIFEPFQQADTGTARKYGGTGLGLSISREIAHLLGGEIRVESVPGQRSTFTLFLPQTHVPPAGVSNRGSAPASGPPTRGPAPWEGQPTEAFRAVTSRAQEGQASGQPFRAMTSGEQEGQASVQPFRPMTPGGGPILGFGSAGLSPSPSPSGATAQAAPSVRPAPAAAPVSDDQANLQPGDRVLLIIDDDLNFAKVLLALARDKGFKGVVALEAETGLALARKLKPDAITLDIKLPDMDGWAVLDSLKHNAETSHIPVHILSALEDHQRGLCMGALAYLTKPVSKESLEGAFGKIKGFLDRKVKRLLVVEDSEAERSSIVALIGDGDVQTTAVGSGAEALAALRAGPFDCMVLDLKLPDMTGFELLARSRKEPGIPELPVVVYTGRSLTREEQAELKKWTEAVVVKDAQSPERLLAETSLFLHRIETNLPESKRKMLRHVHATDPLLANKKVLIVDDDLRNIFALTAILERQRMQAPYAENGKDAINTLQNTPAIDLVLMDIMMPEMDGYETMRQIRAMDQFKSLPIIALTAKAMKGDREKCVAAGASDYIAKPVSAEQLLSLLRVWLYR